MSKINFNFIPRGFEGSKAYVAITESLVGYEIREVKAEIYLELSKKYQHLGIAYDQLLQPDFMDLRQTGNTLLAGVASGYTCRFEPDARWGEIFEQLDETQETSDCAVLYMDDPDEQVDSFEDGEHSGGFGTDARRLCGIPDAVDYPKSLLYLDKIELLPLFRGRGLGGESIYAIVDALCKDIGMVAFQPFPLQYGNDRVDEWNGIKLCDPAFRGSLAHESFLEAINSQMEKLVRYYRSLEFHSFPLNRLMIASPAQLAAKRSK